jgi:hypothetical protein
MEYRGEAESIVICMRCASAYAKGMIADLIQLEASARINDLFPNFFLSRTSEPQERRQMHERDQLLLHQVKAAEEPDANVQ